jgi:hypothetical protein
MTMRSGIRASKSRCWTGAWTIGLALLGWALATNHLIAAESVGEPTTNAPGNSALGELIKPSKKIAFPEVIHATTGHRVLEFDTNNSAHVELRRKILRAAALTGERARRQGIDSARANEAGNQIEPIVREALKDVGLDARIPKTTAGRAQVAGYPDIEIAGAVPCYVELKIYNANTADTTQRSFY